MGNPSGREPSKKVYSCSRPKRYLSPLTFSSTATQAARVLVGCGVMSVRRTSQRTSLLAPLRMGSGQTNTGLSTQSEREPGAWLVEEPSKPQIGGSAPSGTTFVLERSFAVGCV